MILTSIIDHAIDLDLRNPSCPTFGMLAAFYKCLAIGMDNVLELSKMDKYNDVMFVKKMFHQRAKFAKPPMSIIDILPESPSTFIEGYPSTASVFDDEMPSTCPFDFSTFLAVADSFPLRRPKTMVPSSAVLSLPSSDSRANLWEVGGGGLQHANAMASFFMQTLQSNPGLMRNLLRPPRGHDDEDEDIGLRYTPPRRERELQTALARGPDCLGNKDSPAPQAQQPPKEPSEVVEAHAPMKSKKLKLKKKRRLSESFQMHLPRWCLLFRRLTRPLLRCSTRH